MSKTIKTWDSGVGIITEAAEQTTAASIERTVFKPHTYSSHERAARYGQFRDPAPIKMLDGSERWIAMPFWKADGRVYLYTEVAIRG